MNALNVLWGLALFLAGVVAALLVISYSLPALEKPFSFGDSGPAISPSDRLTNDNILVYPDRVVLKISGATISSYDSTGSMRPVLNNGTNGIRVKPQSESDIRIGDIVTFKEGDNLIVHRVVEKGTDEGGAYFITKGDNNDFPDEKIRFSQIEYITVGLIY